MKTERRDANTAAETERVASSTECTGLVPALPGEEGEQARRELYAVTPAKRPGRMYRKK